MGLLVFSVVSVDSVVIITVSATENTEFTEEVAEGKKCDWFDREN